MNPSSVEGQQKGKEIFYRHRASSLISEACICERFLDEILDVEVFRDWLEKSDSSVEFLFLKKR